MFWGLIVEPKKRYTQTVQASFHVSSAVIDPEYKGDEPTSLFVQVEGQDYAIAILKKNQQTPLDLNLEEGMQISFHSKGSAVIHLTGYLIPMGDEGDEGDSFLDSEAEDEEVSGEEDEDEAPQLKAVKGKKGKAAKEESSEDEEVEDEDESSEEEEPQPAKKQKVEKKKEITTPQKENGQQLSKNQLKKQKQEAQAAGQVEQKAAPKTLQGGVMVEELKMGSGPEAKPGKKVAVYYVGRLKHNNKQFDATQKGPGFKFKLGAGEVIKGWDVGVAGMKVGGKRRIVCPHQMAYGTKGAPPAIPPNSTLVFDVELKAVN